MDRRNEHDSEAVSFYGRLFIAKGKELKIFRTVAVIFPQLTILLILGASFDFLFGFNRTDYGFTTLLFLFVAAPIVDFSWLLSEIVISIRQAKHRDKTMSFLMSGIALLFFIESIIIDIFLLSQARM